jgi:hypothetical protein
MPVSVAATNAVSTEATGPRQIFEQKFCTEF